MEIYPEEGVRFTPRLTQSKVFCCVYGCSSRAAKDPTVRFHRFPKPDECFVDVINNFGVVEKVDKLKAWEMALKLGKEISCSMKVCSLHFTKDDYILPDAPSRRRCLKKLAVPSLNMPKVEMAVENRSVGKTRHRKQVHKHREWNFNNQEPVEIVYVNVVRVVTVMNVEQLQPSHIETGTTTLQRGNSFTLRNCIKTNQQLRHLTGIESFGIFNRIVHIVHSVYPEITKSKSKLEKNIIMTFVKLKQNLSYQSLAVLCRIGSPQKCERLFVRMLEVLSECLRPAIYWPTKTETGCNIPKSFKGFEGIRVVLDCAEIKIEKSKKLFCKVQTYSPYKKDYTMKFVIGFSPAGVVSFISEPFGGRMSDKATLKNCNLIRMLDRYDFMMIEKRFVTDDVCKDKQIKFIARVNYVKGHKQLPSSYVLVNSKDPKMGEDVETMNKEIKNFKILNDRLPAKLIEKSRDILTIICATVNMSSPVLKDYKFEL